MRRCLIGSIPENHLAQPQHFPQNGVSEAPSHRDGIKILSKLLKRATLNQNPTLELVLNHHRGHEGKRARLSREQAHHGHIVDLGKDICLQAGRLQKRIVSFPSLAVTLAPRVPTVHEIPVLLTLRRRPGRILIRF